MNTDVKHPASFDDRLIDWKRIAEPQADQYDTRVVLELMRRQGYQRKEVGNDPSFFDGKVALRNHSPAWAPECIPAPPDHPNVARGCELIRLWPVVFAQFQALTESVSIFMNQRGAVDAIVGSVSGSCGVELGTIAVTVDNHVGFAEGLVHEMGHHKLRALGIEFECAERIVRNPREQRFKSPIRYDCLRPMSAVLHAQYSYMFVTSLDIEILRARLDPERDRSVAQLSLAVILPKLQFGIDVIRKHAELDEAGT